LAEALISDSQNERAAQILKEALNSFRDHKSPRYIELQILYLEAAGRKRALINYLIKIGLTVVEQHMNFERGNKYIQMIASYYEGKNDYASANHYLRISNQHLKNLLFNIGLPVEHG